MRTIDLLQETSSALKSNKARTGLTMLGIIIGIGSVIAMTAIGRGASNSISESIESIGANLVMVMPGAQRSFGGGPNASRGGAQSLTLSDAIAIESVDGVEAVVREVTTRSQVVATGTNTNTSIIGTEASYSYVRNVSIAEGDFISDQNVSSSAKVAVLGATTKDDLFGEDATNVIGETVRISGTLYKVIGIAAEKGGSGFSNSDDAVYIPYTTAQRYLSGNKYLSQIDIRAESSEISSVVQEDVTTLLLDRHNITDPDKADFNTMNQADIIETASSVTSTFTALLAAVASISLLVGGIGIMNMMLTTVTERTREIGLRKAIGAKKKDINIQFLIEAVMLTFLGGALGIILGWLISFSMSYFGILQADVSLSSVLLAFGVSAFIGIIFGYYPAHRAAGLNPIDALRYE